MRIPHHCIVHAGKVSMSSQKTPVPPKWYLAKYQRWRVTWHQAAVTSIETKSSQDAGCRNNDAVSRPQNNRQRTQAAAPSTVLHPIAAHISVRCQPAATGQRKSDSPQDSTFLQMLSTNSRGESLRRHELLTWTLQPLV